MNIILGESLYRKNLLPLVATKPESELRTGILTISEKWKKYWKHYQNEEIEISFSTQDYLQELFPLKTANDNIWISGNCIPDENLIKKIATLKTNEVLVSGDDIIALKGNESEVNDFLQNRSIGNKNKVEIENAGQIKALHDLIYMNETHLKTDFDILTKGRVSAKINDSNRCINIENIFVEEGAIINCANLNASSGPIYIDKDAEVMEGTSIRGPFYLGEHSQTKLNTKIYGPTTIGPHCKVGGEVTRSVMQGYSNKGHDGFLGDSYIGEWCNLGADTNNSNLKNNYADVKLWNYDKKRFVSTGKQFCGLIMGDHSKCGINTMFNTGTVVGICANIFGAGFPRNFVPDFAWGGAQGFETYKPDKVFETTELVMKRRNLELTLPIKNMLTSVFEKTEEHRYWEKNG